MPFLTQGRKRASLRRGTSFLAKAFLGAKNAHTGETSAANFNASTVAGVRLLQRERFFREAGRQTGGGRKRRRSRLGSRGSLGS
jgi:hypothetical protein